MLLNSTTMRIKTCYNSLNKYFHFGSVKAEVSHIKAPHRYNLKNAVKVQVVHSVSSNAHVMGQSVEAQYYYYDRHHLHLFSFGGISRSEEYFHSPQNDLVDGSLQENGQQMHYWFFYLGTFIFTESSIRTALPLFCPRTGRLSTLTKGCLAPSALRAQAKLSHQPYFK